MTVHYLRFGIGTSGINLQATNANNNGTGVGSGAPGSPTRRARLSGRSTCTGAVQPAAVQRPRLGRVRRRVREHGASSASSWRPTASSGSCRAPCSPVPYVMMCLVYSIGFIYAFAALGNLGLIYRERVMLLPFLMVLFAIPRSPRGQPAMYEWEYRRKDRARFRAAVLQREPDGAARCSWRWPPPNWRAPPTGQSSAGHGSHAGADPAPGSTGRAEDPPGRPTSGADARADRPAVPGDVRPAAPSPGGEQRGEHPQPQRPDGADAEPVDAPGAGRLAHGAPEPAVGHQARPGASTMAVEVVHARPRTPVVPSSMTVRTPGTSVATTGRPDRPPSMSTPGHALALGPAREDHDVGPAEQLGHVRSREPSSSTPAAAAGPSIAVAQGPVADEDGPEPQSPVAQRGDGLDEPVGALAVGERTRRRRPPGGRRPVRRAGGGRPSGSRPLGVMVTRSAGTPSSRVHSSATSSPSAATASTRRSSDATAPPGRSASGEAPVGADGVVGERAAPADHGRHQVLEGLAPVGHDARRVEAGRAPAAAGVRRASCTRRRGRRRRGARA